MEIKLRVSPVIKSYALTAPPGAGPSVQVVLRSPSSDAHRRFNWCCSFSGQLQDIFQETRLLILV